MNSKRIQLLLAGVGVCISLLVMITTTYGASIVIGGSYASIGTIVVISPNPGDTPEANGMVLIHNLAGITADANHPYLIKLGPGIYDIGTGSLQMKQYVDIEGSGENTTIIAGDIDSITSGVVRGVSNAEIRFLTVRNIGGGSSAIAIYSESGSPTITNVTAFASGGSNTSIGVNNFNTTYPHPTMRNVTTSASGGIYNYGLYTASSSPTMTNVTASASGGTYNYGLYNVACSSTIMNVTASASGGTYNYGVFNGFSSPTMRNITASASGGTSNYGVYSSSGTVMIDHSVIIGSTNTIYNDANTTTRVGNTKLAGGGVFNTSGTLTCAGVYDENYTFYASTCP